MSAPSGVAGNTAGVAPRPLPPWPLTKAPVDFWWLLKGELYVVRLAWFWYLFQMSFVPLTTMLFLRLFAGHGDGATVLFVVTGSIAQGLTTASMLSLGQQIGALKDQNAFEHYATLPVGKVAFLLAVASRGMLLALPSVAILLAFAALGLGTPLQATPLLLLAIPLAGYSMAGLGAMIGFYSPTGQVASLATQVISPLLVFFAPVYIPVERLPEALRVTSHLIPTTYVARALRDALGGTVTAGTWGDLSILLAFTVASLWFVARKAEWRAGD